jgi:hypothetical protein
MKRSVQLLSEDMRRNELGKVYFGYGSEWLERCESNSLRIMAHLNGLNGQRRMAGAMTGGAAMVRHGMFVNRTGGTLFNRAEVTLGVFVFCKAGQFVSACAPTKTGYGNGKHYHHHEKGNVFFVKLAPHASFTPDLY